MRTVNFDSLVKGRSVMKVIRCVLVGVVVGLVGCSSVRERAVVVVRGGLVDLGVLPQEVHPLVVDVLVDGTEGSPGVSSERVWAVVDAELPLVIASEGSFRLWSLTGDGALLGAVFVARLAHRVAELARARAVLAPALDAPLPRVALSRLFAAVTRIAAETTDERALRHVVLVSDLRAWDLSTSDASGVDWECGPITVLDRLTPLLDRERYLLPDSMRGIAVQVLYFTPSTIGRCPGHETARYAALQSRWTALLQRAGATVEFRTAGIPARTPKE
jgi:hypothetical protein